METGELPSYEGPGEFVEDAVREKLEREVDAVKSKELMEALGRIVGSGEGAVGASVGRLADELGWDHEEVKKVVLKLEQRGEVWVSGWTVYRDGRASDRLDGDHHSGPLGRGENRAGRTSSLSFAKASEEQMATDSEEDYETVVSETREFGEKFYLEVSRKRTDDGEGGSSFIAVERGFYTEDGSKRETALLTLPDDPELVEFVSHRLKELSDAMDDGLNGTAPSEQ